MNTFSVRFRTVLLVVVITMFGFLYSPWSQWTRPLHDIVWRAETTPWRENHTSSNRTNFNQGDSSNRTNFNQRDTFPSQKVTFPETCAPNRTFMNCCQPLTALASFPGSGNTWLRHLLEEATGYYTGSVYLDRALIQKGFQGEGRRNGEVIAIKTHLFGQKNKIDFERILLILRSPFQSFLAEFNRKQTLGDHTGHASDGTFRKAWENFFRTYTIYYKHFHEYWFSRGVPMYIIDYETLKTDLREELKRILHFLGVSIGEERLDCVVHNSEGSFHRKPSADQFDPYTDEMKEVLNDLVKEVNKMRNEVMTNETRLST